MIIEIVIEVIIEIITELIIEINIEISIETNVDIFIGTTGRVLDHMNRGNLNFSQVKFICLDEADEMLKMGFKEDVDQILGTINEHNKEKPQFLLFSATVPRWIKDLASHYLKPTWKMLDLAKDLKGKT